MSRSSHLLDVSDSESGRGYSSYGGNTNDNSGGVGGFMSTAPAQVTKRTWHAVLIITTIAIGLVVILAITTAMYRHDDDEDKEKNGGGGGGSGGGGSPPTPGDLVWNTQIDDMMVHLNQLQAIANTWGNRDVTQPGFNASVDYIMAQLATTGFTVRREYFGMEEWVPGRSELITYDARGYNISFIRGVDFNPVTNSGQAGPNVENATGVFVPNAGCNQADWDYATSQYGSLVGRVAVMPRASVNVSCTIRQQAQNALNNKLGGVIVHNIDQTNEPPTVRPGDAVTRYMPIPVFIVTRTLGLGLVESIGGGNNTFFIDMTLDLVSANTTWVSNIVADTPGDNWQNTVVVGSHCDGVLAGPGINDNGSGSAANLAMALRIADWIKQGIWNPPNRIRFVWFGAEERGLFGSHYHVKQAQRADAPPQDSIDTYVVMLNYDMLGSSNFFNGVYNATVAPAGTPDKALVGSRTVTSTYYDFFTHNNLPYDGTPFDGRSDYGGFLAAGVVAGGLFSGAEGIKPQELKDRYAQILGPEKAGIANAAFDPCYHRFCDNVQNINQGAYLNLTRAAAHTLQVLAMQKDLRGFLNYPAYAPPSASKQ